MSVVSKEFNFGQQQAQCVPVMRQRVKVQPHNRAVVQLKDVQGQQEIYIPTGSVNKFMSLQSTPYLTFKATFGAGAKAGTGADGQNCTYQGTAASAIRQIQVYHGSQKLCDIDNYGRVNQMLRDLQTTNAHNDVEQGATAGSRVSPAQQLPASGADLTKWYSIPLVGLLSSATYKALPLGALGNANLRVVITWNSFVQATNVAIQTASTNTVLLDSYSISNVDLVYEELEFAAADAENIMKQSGGGFAINTIGIETHQKTLTSGITSDTTFIPVKVGQLKSILSGYFNGSDNQLTRVQPYSASGEFTYKVGSKAYPQQPVVYEAGAGEVKYEVLKAMRPLSYTDNNLLGDFKTNAFLVGCDFEGYAGVNEDKLMSGVYTYGADVFLNQKFNGALAGDRQLFSVCMFDAQVVISGGLAVLQY